ncbi:hypothetical protein PPROV_000607400 [Pycnococcus provasolii]|uniref:Rhodanese domain-containing protein n=1 Tax=Pycnococcus provasolii TaxID=41880 RepID=A0A830HL25_9CHLO|nr:hypothetical protein PPROV_000607400 [Pycnococcus provasolii]
MAAMLSSFSTSSSLTPFRFRRCLSVSSGRSSSVCRSSGRSTSSCSSSCGSLSCGSFMVQSQGKLSRRSRFVSSLGLSHVSLVVSCGSRVRSCVSAVSLGSMGSRSATRVLCAYPEYAAEELELCEENIDVVLEECKTVLAQMFDRSVGITGEVTLAELDGPFVKLSLKGKFWHKREDVVARVGTYMKQRIPEVLEVTIDDESQLDDYIID